MVNMSRYPGDSVKIGDNITIRVKNIEGGRVFLDVRAPSELRILRINKNKFHKTTTEPQED